jgi:hypothetical protein
VQRDDAPVQKLAPRFRPAADDLQLVGGEGDDVKL